MALRLTVFEEQATVAYLEGRVTLDGSHPLWPQQREAFEFVQDEQRAQAERELRRMVRRGVVSPFQLDREFA